MELVMAKFLSLQPDRCRARNNRCCEASEEDGSVDIEGTRHV